MAGKQSGVVGKWCLGGPFFLLFLTRRDRSFDRGAANCSASRWRQSRRSFYCILVVVNKCAVGKMGVYFYKQI
jgi:hypothetical protein